MLLALICAGIQIIPPVTISGLLRTTAQDVQAGVLTSAIDTLPISTSADESAPLTTEAEDQ